jgi:2-phosphosulfolactate phosphatase
VSPGPGSGPAQFSASTRVRVLFSGTELLALRARPGVRAPRAVAVIDVLRATTTLVHAFAHGAARACAFATAAEAQAARARYGPDEALLCGERGGLRIPGFDLGNSPSEYAPERVAGRTLLVTTTNGTRALARTADAGRQVLAAFVNLPAAARRLAQLAADPALAALADEVWIVAAGKEEAPGEEDSRCARALADLLAGASPVAIAPDEAELCAFLGATEHGRALLEVSPRFAADLADAARWGRFGVVPEGSAAVLEPGAADAPGEPGTPAAAGG